MSPILKAINLTSEYKEVNCTEPSTSVRDPWCHPTKIPVNGDEKKFYTNRSLQEDVDERLELSTTVQDDVEKEGLRKEVGEQEGGDYGVVPALNVIKNFFIRH